ncbi:MAG: magnesium transporter CorA family protein [Clostridiaceae bacterium]|jgi:magnesium transporter|nr:magnesium transporter CorA family protein [Clostridiaceae bacterium]
MIEIYKTQAGTELLHRHELLKLDSMEKGCWINLVSPTEEEIELVVNSIDVNQDFIRDALDDEEKPRIDVEDGQTLIIIDIPYVYEDNKTIKFETLPMGFLTVRDDYIITISSRQTTVLERFRNAQIKDFYTYKKTRFILQILYHVSTEYLKYLKHIDKKSEFIEKSLHKSMRNKELYKLLDLSKSLVYFNTSLKSNETVLERLLTGKFIKLYEEDADLLEDTIIENKQAIEMATIYSSILSGTMDAFASIISNNQNEVMKFLAAMTIVLSIPNMVYSFFGQNFPLPLGENPLMWLYVLAGSVVICLIMSFILWKRDMF